ncbi:MAG: hypothetical protein ACKODH_00505 [Limisphaerales bacterium]
MTLCLCAALTLTVSACRKKPAAAPAPEPPPPANAANALEMAMSNATALTMGLQEYMAKNGKPPADLNELVTAKLVQKIPPLPPGYKYEIDAKRKQVTVTKQP